MKNILILAPHPDDEVLGCGGTIRKSIKKGNIVFVAILTNANKTDPIKYNIQKLERIRKEAKESHQLLGISKTFFEDFPAPMLDQHPIYLMAEKISNIIKETGAEIIYVPHRGDIHNDHKAIFDAAMVACRPVNKYSVKTILAYETLSETEWAHPFQSDAFIPNYFEILEEDEFQSKLDAMRCYISQLRDFPSSRSIETLTSLAKYRGSTINSCFAEAFMTMRIIE